jgi:UDP-N-acetylglucosamine diphosphorylase/glucosamine-1-phosphate N-acetyltransferase
MLDQGARVMSHSVIYGPCYVGRDTIIKAGAKIYGPCSFGPVCKLGGEIAETVVLGYSNKQHDGFLGHAYVGEWVNMGAGTEVSDLNNNYGTIRTWVEGAMVDSGSMFVGPTIGDHTKTGINTMLNSGTVVGFACNIFGSDYLPKFVPSFSWGGKQALVEHDRHKAFETASRMTARRNVIMGDIEQALFAEIYELTRLERQGHVKEHGK